METDAHRQWRAPCVALRAPPADWLNRPFTPLNLIEHFSDDIGSARCENLPTCRRDTAIEVTGHPVQSCKTTVTSSNAPFGAWSATAPWFWSRRSASTGLTPRFNLRPFTALCRLGAAISFRKNFSLSLPLSVRYLVTVVVSALFEQLPSKLSPNLIRLMWDSPPETTLKSCRWPHFGRSFPPPSQGYSLPDG